MPTVAYTRATEKQSDPHVVLGVTTPSAAFLGEDARLSQMSYRHGLSTSDRRITTCCGHTSQIGPRTNDDS